MPRITCITSSPRNCPIERIICFCWFISLMTAGSFLFRPCPPGGMELLMSTAARGVFLDADFAQVIGLLVVQRILVACRSGRPQRDDLVVEGIFDVLRRRARARRR